MRSFRLVQGLPYELLPGPSANVFTLNSVYEEGAKGALWLPDAHKAFLEQSRDANQVINGTFDADASDWLDNQATLDSVSGELEITSTAASFGQAVQVYTLNVGDWVYVGGSSRKGTAATSAEIAFWDGAAQSTVLFDSDGSGTSGGRFFQVKAPSCQIKLTANVNAVGQTAYFDNIVLERLPAGAQDAILYRTSKGSDAVTSGQFGLALNVADFNGTFSAFLAGQSELVTNGGFDTGNLTGFTDNSTGTGSIVYESGQIRLQGTNSSNRGIASQAITTVANRYYQLQTSTTLSSGEAAVGASETQGATATLQGALASAGDASFIFQAVGTTTYLNMYTGSSGGDVLFDNLTIKEVGAEHLYQLSDANRPSLNITNGKYSWDFNGTNSSLISDFAGGAGPSDCSIFVALKTTDNLFVLFRGHHDAYYLPAVQDGSGVTVLHANSGTPDIYICDVGAGETVLSEFTGTTRDDLHTAIADGNWKIVEFRGADLSAWTEFGISTFPGWELLGSIGGAVQRVESGPILEANRAKIVTEMIELLPS